ncbi:QWRF family protein [Dioscorea alata]|uniref:QWRF family protein n=1 Tax=Dioscorea alata TaxID=55571 RepID=A0ACB7WJP0_DIOAL|nr:QWRF family protein [Dioscorea alata]
MDMSSIEPLGVVAQQKALLKDNIPWHPLVSSEKNNAVLPSRKSQVQEIGSRYKSTISLTVVSTLPARKRCPSPNPEQMSSASGMLLTRRSQSAERRCPSTFTSKNSAASSLSSRPSITYSPSSMSTTPIRDSMLEVHNTSRRLLSNRAHDGLWPSMRSLTTSFQSESVSNPPGRKVKPVRDSSPDHSLKSIANVDSERKRTPLRRLNATDQSENFQPAENLHLRVVEQHRWPRISGSKLPANIPSRSMDLNQKVNRSNSLPVVARVVSPRRLLASNCSGNRLRQPASMATYVTRSNRTQSFSSSSLHRPLSPKKSLASSTTSRGTQSPSKTRSSSPFSSSSTSTGQAAAMSSVLDYIVDARKGKKSANQIEDTYHLRLLYNRNLQWRFLNAISVAASVIQKVATEDALCGVWNTTSELRDFVNLKRVNLLCLKEEMKLDVILREQLAYLEDWAALEKEHSGSLSAATEALKASTLCLPVSGGAKVDVRAIKNAISSAVDTMQKIGSSICYSLSKVVNMNHLATELSDAAMIEMAMLDECGDLLASAAAMQMQEFSLRTQLMQLRLENVHKMQ